MPWVGHECQRSGGRGRGKVRFALRETCFRFPVMYIENVYLSIVAAGQYQPIIKSAATNTLQRLLKYSTGRTNTWASARWELALL